MWYNRCLSYKTIKQVHSKQNILNIFQQNPILSPQFNPPPLRSSLRSFHWACVYKIDVPSLPLFVADAFFDSDFSRAQISLIEYVRISSIDDGHSRAAVILSACSSQRNVISRIEHNSGL